MIEWITLFTFNWSYWRNQQRETSGEHLKGLKALLINCSCFVLYWNSENKCVPVVWALFYPVCIWICSENCFIWTLKIIIMTSNLIFSVWSDLSFQSPIKKKGVQTWKTGVRGEALSVFDTRDIKNKRKKYISSLNSIFRIPFSKNRHFPRILFISLITVNTEWRSYIVTCTNTT